jgi:hypothetical protein
LFYQLLYHCWSQKQQLLSLVPVVSGFKLSNIGHPSSIVLPTAIPLLVTKQHFLDVFIQFQGCLIQNFKPWFICQLLYQLLYSCRTLMFSSSSKFQWCLDSNLQTLVGFLEGKWTFLSIILTLGFISFTFTDAK